MPCQSAPAQLPDSSPDTALRMDPTVRAPGVTGVALPGLWAPIGSVQGDDRTPSHRRA